MAIFPTREQVYAALFAQVQTAGATFTTYTQNAVLPVDVSVQKSPLLSLLEGNTRTTYDAHRLKKEEWDAFVVIYVRKSPMNQPGRQVINPLVDAVRTVMLPNNPQQNTLDLYSGGVRVASWVRVEGVTVIETGDTDPEGLAGALVPVRMLVP